MTPFAQRELNKLIERTLKEAGLTKPPVRLEDLLAHLKLYQEYYDLSDPAFLNRTKHKMLIGGRRLVEIVKRIKLQAVLFFDENRVAIDRSLPPLKRVWPGFHEAGHRICPLHREIFAFGDTAQTLNPDYQEKLEAEANFAGAGLMFCGKRFTEEARDTLPCWETIDAMAARFGRTMTTTLRRYAGFGPDRVMAAVIGTPAWKVDREHASGSWRHFVPSPQFAERFSCVDVDSIVQLVNVRANPQRGGLVARLPLVLGDDNDDRHEFLAQAFFNTHDLLMIIIHQRKLNGHGRIMVPEPIKVGF